MAITIESLADSLYSDFVTNIVRQITLNSLSRYNAVTNSVCDTHTEYVADNASRNKDIFGQDQQKLKTSETSRYFECSSCGRKIAGGRFAQHVNKCLDRAR